MAHPWANVFILIVGGLSLLTGFLGRIGGSPDWTIALDVHRISGFALVALLLWKGHNVLRPLTNKGRWKRRPALLLSSIAIFLLLLAALTLGIGWSHGGYFAYLGISGVSWHIYLSSIACPLRGMAYPHPLMDPAPPVLGRTSVLSETRRAQYCRPCPVARGGACSRCLGTSRGEQAIYRVIRAEKLRRQRLPNHVLVERRPGPGQRGCLALECFGTGPP